MYLGITKPLIIREVLVFEVHIITGEVSLAQLWSVVCMIADYYNFL